MASASSSSASAGAAVPLSQRRSLLIGSPLYGESLVAQRTNLERFVESHKAEFNDMRYLPWTVVRNESKPIEVRRSTVAPGIRGVYLKQPLQTKRSDTVRASCQQRRTAGSATAY